MLLLDRLLIIDDSALDWLLSPELPSWEMMVLLAVDEI